MANFTQPENSFTSDYTRSQWNYLHNINCGPVKGSSQMKQMSV